MYSRMVLMVVCWRYRMPFDANGCVSTLVNVDWIKWMYFCVNEFEVGVIDSIFSGNEQQKVYLRIFQNKLKRPLYILLYRIISTSYSTLT